MMPAEDNIKAATRALLRKRWQVRPNPIINGIRAVQLSLTYRGHDRVHYVDVVTLSFNAPSIVLHCLAHYDPDFPFDHNVIWEDWMSAADALDYAHSVNDYLDQPADQDPVQPGDRPTQQDRSAPAAGKPDRQAPQRLGQTET